MTNSSIFDVYIAVPYTHDDPAVRQMRYHKATEYLAMLSGAGLVAFSPITHSHPMAWYDLPTSWDFWSNIDMRIIRGCDELHVLTMDGWRESTGVSAEIVAARDLGMVIRYISPKDFNAHSVELPNG